MTATSGFCTQYCAWHTYYVQSGLPIKFAFVGNGARCPNSCAPFTPAPNGNQGADGMASTLVTNPYLLEPWPYLHQPGQPDMLPRHCACPLQSCACHLCPRCQQARLLGGLSLC